MGSDDLHRKRNSESNKGRRRASNTSKRSPPKREKIPRILITCEGSKTEHFYINALRDSLKISSIQIEKSGSSPLTVVNTAIDFYKNNKRFDKIFCIIDRDQHTDYETAINTAQQALLSENDEKQIPELKVITSIPCFEYWLLLHFEDAAQPFHATGKKSICDQVGKELKQYMSFYGKGKELIKNLCENIQQAVQELGLTYKDIKINCCDHKNEQKCFKFIFDKILAPRQDTAIESAKKILQSHIDTGTTDKNPSTEMYEFVEYLKNIVPPNN